MAMHSIKPWRRRMRYLLEAAFAYILYYIFRVLPLEVASAIGGKIARIVGLRCKVSNIALRNLEIAFPEKSLAERKAMLPDIWENLGRTVAEFPHLPGAKIMENTTISGADNLTELKDDGIGGIVFSIHSGNWEMNAKAASGLGFPLIMVYRRANNPYVEHLFRKARRNVYKDMYQKGAGGVFGLIKAIHAGEHLAVLVDQKMNDGIEVPFFGKPAMTSKAIAELALKLDIPVVPAVSQRVSGAKFALNIYPVLQITRSGNHEADVLRIMTEVNKIAEGWIRENPSQYFWLHRRWDKSEYR
jgi:KDO2-lipid IV(A) lauroyltransferase